MTTAVAERPTTASQQPAATTRSTKKLMTIEEVAQQVSALTGQPIDVAANSTIAAIPQSQWRYESGKLVLPETATRDTLAAHVSRINEAIAGMSSAPAPAAPAETIVAPAASTNGIAPATIEPSTEPQPAKPARKPRATAAAAKKTPAKKTPAKKPAATRARKAKDTAE